jgi:Sugar (and other) transporter
VKLKITACRAPDVRPEKALRKLKRAIRVSDLRWRPVAVFSAVGRTSEGWRICFLVGPALAFVILFMRRNLSESPQWLMTHGREREAEEAFRRIEEAAITDGQRLEPVVPVAIPGPRPPG